MFRYQAYIRTIFAFASMFYWSDPLYAQLSSGTNPFSSSPQTVPTEPLKQQPIRPNRSPSRDIPPPSLQQPATVARSLSYFYPGVIVFKDGAWQGTEHLLNVGRQIGVYVEIFLPEGDRLTVNQAGLQKIVEDIFIAAGISTQVLVPSNKPPLPAFEVRIFLYPVENGYAACCEGRLFESVILNRFYLDPNMAFQAITWQRGSLLVASRLEISKSLENRVAEIATSFVEVFRAYERFLKGARR